MKKKTRVVVIGGGIAGLSVAHELAERDFDVTVYERNSSLGGKARSVDISEGHAQRALRAERGKSTNKALAGEHGFRFFPGWYKHLPDTMSRIPYSKTGKSVLENLVAADMSWFATYNHDPIKAVVTFPFDWEKLKLVLRFPKEVIELVPRDDLEFFVRKMVQFLVSCEDRRVADYENQSWWDFTEADKRSKEYRQYLVTGASRNSVAAKPRQASAYTIGKMAIQTFFEVAKPTGALDRVLNGPSSEVWIEPWQLYLEEQGVKFEMGWELESIIWPRPGSQRPSNEIENVTFKRPKDELKEAQALLTSIEFLRAAHPELEHGSRDPASFARKMERIADLQQTEALAADIKKKRVEALRGPRGHDFCHEVNFPFLAWEKTLVDEHVARGGDVARGLARAYDWYAAMVSAHGFLGVANPSFPANADHVYDSRRQRSNRDRVQKAMDFFQAVRDRHPRALANFARGISGDDELPFGERLTAELQNKFKELRARGASLEPNPELETKFFQDGPIADFIDCFTSPRMHMVREAFVHLHGTKEHVDDATAMAEFHQLEPKRQKFVLDPVIAYLKTVIDALLDEQRYPHFAEPMDYVVFALPVEQMAYYVNRSPTLLKHDASLANIIRLSEHVDWMAGIQFYLKEEVGITRGHIDFLDSEWSLTAISQTQFWEDIDLKDRGFGDCKTILSVDIAAWDTKGTKISKAAWECTRQEIAEEVWDQLKRALNRPGRPPLLTNDQLCPAVQPRMLLEEGRNYHLDDSIVDRYDRKKQGFYEKFRRVAFDANTLVKSDDGQRPEDAPEAYGTRLQINAEPLLVNRPGSMALRPQAKTGIPNMFVAADYVQTLTNLATMESANEAARHAVNAIVAASSSSARTCRIWPLEEPGDALRLLDREFFKRKQTIRDVYADIPVQFAGAGIQAVFGMGEKAVSTARDLWKTITRK